MAYFQGRTVSFREGSCEKCSTRWFKLTFWSPNVGCHFANVRIPFALIAGIEKKSKPKGNKKPIWLVLFELVTSLRKPIMVNSPFFYNQFGIHPGKLTCPPKRDYFNRKYIFQPSIFRGHASFGECNFWQNCPTLSRQPGVFGIPRKMVVTKDQGKSPPEILLVSYPKDPGMS